MRIASIFASGYSGDGGDCCRYYDYGGDQYDYSFESRNRPGGNEADFNDRDFPVPMFRGNRAGPITS
jgi:hypothetical protein